MRHKVDLLVHFVTRQTHPTHIHVEAESGNEAAERAQADFKETEFHKRHGTNIGRVDVIGIMPDPLPIPEPELEPQEIVAPQVNKRIKNKIEK